jgi:hypothetical protein
VKDRRRQPIHTLNQHFTLRSPTDNHPIAE